MITIFLDGVQNHMSVKSHPGRHRANLHYRHPRMPRVAATDYVSTISILSLEKLFKPKPMKLLTRGVVGLQSSDILGDFSHTLLVLYAIFRM